MITKKKKRKASAIDLYIGKQIKKFRQEQKLTQTELSVAANTTFQQIQKYESGINRVSAGTLFNIANHLNKPLKVFFPQEQPQ